MNLTNMQRAVLLAMSECDSFTDVINYPDEWATIGCPTDEVSDSFARYGHERISLGGVVASLKMRGLVECSDVLDHGRRLPSSRIYLTEPGVTVLQGLMSEES